MHDWAFALWMSLTGLTYVAHVKISCILPVSPCVRETSFSQTEGIQVISGQTFRPYILEVYILTE